MLELAAAATHASGGPFFDAEELRFKECFDQCRAVDGDERTISSSAQFMNLPGDELLAHPAFPFEQDGEIGAGHTFDLMA